MHRSVMDSLSRGALEAAFLLACISCFPLSLAQESTPPDPPEARQALTLSGTVQLKETGAFLSNVAITLLSSDPTSQVRLETRTDPTGHFAFTSLPPGQYRLEFSLAGCNLLQVNMYLRATHRATGFTFFMTRLQTLPAEVVRDRAIQGETPAAFSSVGREALEEAGPATDVPSVLTMLPSTLFYSENGNGVGYNYVSIRGFDQRRISVLIDGVPQNDPEDHNVYWINVADLLGATEDVQVQRGASTTSYGPPAIGGSINLLTRRLEAEPFQRLEIGGGSFGTARVSAEVNSGLLRDHLMAYARVSHLESEGYRDWSWVKTWRGYGAIASYGPNGYVRLQAYGGPQRDALAYYGIGKEDNLDLEGRRYNYGAPSDGRTGDVEVFNQTHIDLQYGLTLGKRWSFQGTLYYLSGVGYFDFDGSWGTPQYFQLCDLEPSLCADDADGVIPADTMIRAFVDNKQVGYLPRLTLTHRFGELNMGLELRSHRSLHWGSLLQGSFPTEIASQAVGEEVDRHYYSYRGGKDIASVYVAERIRLFNWLLDAQVQALALRYQLLDEAYYGNTLEKSYTFLNPRAGVRHLLLPWWSVFGSVGLTSREPRLKELYDAENAGFGALPDPDAVRPEHLLDTEAGMNFERERLKVTANAFLMNFKDEIVKTGGLDQFGQPYTGNAARTRHMGLELEGAVRPLPSLEMMGNVTLSRNEFMAFTEYVPVEDDETGASQTLALERGGNPIASSPDVIWNGRLRYTWKPVQLALEVRHVGLQYVDNSADTYASFEGTSVSADGMLTVDPYTLVGAQVGWEVPWFRPRHDLALQLSIQNLLNEKILLAGNDAGFFPAATRSIFLNLSYMRSR